MDASPHFPGFSTAQLRYLDAVFPARCARKGA
jgi:hypothetical protein